MKVGKSGRTYTGLICNPFRVCPLYVHYILFFSFPRQVVLAELYWPIPHSWTTSLDNCEQLNQKLLLLVNNYQISWWSLKPGQHEDIDPNSYYGRRLQFSIARVLITLVICFLLDMCKVLWARITGLKVNPIFSPARDRIGQGPRSVGLTRNGMKSDDGIKSLQRGNLEPQCPNAKPIIGPPPTMNHL